MEIEKQVIAPFRTGKGEDFDYKVLGNKKVPTIHTRQGCGFGYFGDISFIMETKKEIIKAFRNADDKSLGYKTLDGEKFPTVKTWQTSGIGYFGDRSYIMETEEDKKGVSCLTPKRTEYGKRIRKQYELGEIKEQRKNMQQLEPRKDGKTGCLTTVQKDNMVVENLHINDNGELVVPEATKKGFAEVKDGECFDGSFLNSKTRRGRTMQEKSNCLMNSSQELFRYEGVRKVQQLNDAKEYGNQPRQQNLVYDEEGISPTLNTDHPTNVLTRCRIRRLTPTECARLQSIPDWYEWKGKFPDGKIKDTSDTQRYKMLGNGWNVEVIKHIFSFIDIVK